MVAWNKKVLCLAFLCFFYSVSSMKLRIPFRYDKTTAPGYGESDCVVEAYSDVGYRGYQSMANADQNTYFSFAGSAVSSIIITKGCIGVMEDAQGIKQEFEDGIENLATIGWNDRIVKISIFPQNLCRVRVFSNENFGRSWTDVIDKAPNMAQSRIGDDQARSYRIMKCDNKDVHFCHDYGFRGYCVKYSGRSAFNYADWRLVRSVTIDDRGYKTTIR